MNAMTGQDYTLYPFSSQNAQDFKNLMSVYTDSVFLPKLNYYDFRQEGHRLEFNEPEDASSGIQRKGVVFNEMKGVVSQTDRAFLYRLNENLFKKSQYHWNSGGDPKYITDLSYQELVEFHEKYYHPSNAKFFTYGDLDFTQHLKFVEEQVLQPYFERNTSINSEVMPEDKLSEPIFADEFF